MPGRVSAAGGRGARALIALASTLGVVALGGLEGRAVSRDLETPRDLHRVAFVGSAACTRCHAGHAASFGRTFHRTMTREAAVETVRAPFAGETLAYGGFVARMTREPRPERTVDGRPLDGLAEEGPIVTGSRNGEPRADRSPRFVVELTRDGELVDRAEVALTVGSHRHQQLLARQDDRWVRLPIAWHVEEERWFHMNEAFLTADPAGHETGEVALADYARHVVPWNDNCIFCHNVGARPHRDPVTERFATEVAELGIACEACHGPGAEHARVNESPLRRYALHRGGLASPAADPTIVNPARLSPERAADVCGRCHGQRITDEVGRYLTRGDPFVPGEDLALYSAPLFADTTLRGEENVFAARFWDDGTARLTAYEYQGLTQSRCATEGDLTCIDCHAMHDGDPRGQLRPSVTGDRMCTRCHEALADRAARAAHGLADAALAPREGPPHATIACIDCHMPRIVYGMRTIHRSHRIDSPRIDARSDRPDACTLCHLDGGLRDDGLPGERTRRLDDLFQGDPLQRAVVAAALGRGDLASPGPREGTALLLEAMRDDDYPAVRAIAWTGVRALSSSPPPIDAFRATDSRRERTVAIEAIARELGISPAPAARHATLRARASTRAIEIGE